MLKVAGDLRRASAAFENAVECTGFDSILESLLSDNIKLNHLIKISRWNESLCFLKQFYPGV